MLERIKKLYQQRRILWDMGMGAFKDKYRGSKLGVWWAVFTPLILALSINFVFSLVFKAGIPNYAVFVLSGIIPWIFFSSSLTEVTGSFIGAGLLLRQGAFSREIVPLSLVLGNLLNFLAGFIFLLPLFLIFNFKIIALLPLLVLVVVLHCFFLAGLGLLFSSINVFFRDLASFLSIGTMVWFWVTPVFYSLGMVPYPWRWICLANPVTYYVVSYQRILFEAKPPELTAMGACFLFSVFFLIAGFNFFIKKEPQLLKRL